MIVLWSRFTGVNLKTRSPGTVVGSIGAGMFVKKHYSGLCISYAGSGGGRRSLSPTPAKPNNSRLNRQKRQVHDAVEWMRRNAVHKPLIFCCTVPVQSDWSMQNTNVSKFCENIRSNYDVKNYCWVREYTGAGRPHYHFVADAPYMDAVALSRYWSSLFGESALNSIRMGTSPANPPVRYFVNSARMARYLTKYMGKSIGDEEHKDGEKKIRTFGISQECAAKSRPVVYEAKYIYTKEIFTNVHGKVNGTMIKMGEEVELTTDIKRCFTLCENSEGELVEVYGQVPDEYKVFDDTNYSWFCPNPLHHVYYGLPKKMQKAGR